MYFVTMQKSSPNFPPIGLCALTNSCGLAFRSNARVRPDTSVPCAGSSFLFQERGLAPNAMQVPQETPAVAERVSFLKPARPRRAGRKRSVAPDDRPCLLLPPHLHAEA